MHDGSDSQVGQCPVMHANPNASNKLRSNRDWWPNQLNLNILHQNHPAQDPMGIDFDYAAAFAALDLEAVKADIAALLTTTQDWWPAD